MNPLLHSRLATISLVALAGLLAPLLSTACATGSRSEEPARSSTFISLEDIQASSASNAFELVQQIRPQWLRGRGATSLQDPQPILPVVYLGEMSFGPVESLRGFAIQGIEELRFIDARTATTRFGAGHAGGVIQVVPRR
jgi:hypothetical protein